MVGWDKIIESNVIRTFRDICHKLWGIDIQFYDRDGDCKSDNIPFKNPLCRLVHSKKISAKHCIQYYKKYLKRFNKSKTPFIYKCHAGLQCVAVPIFVNEKYIGAMISSGMQVSKNKDSIQKMYVRKLTKFGFDREEVRESYNKLKMVHDHSKEYLLDFMEMIVKDVITFYEMLQEKEALIKKQSVLLERAYNEKYKGIIGTSPAMKRIFDTLGMVENSKIPVLVEGETGTGKELLVAATHYNSPRRNKMFVTLNCSVFSDNLLSSELFGHEKGAFTGAVSDKKGMFEVADGGTLFLDEIGEMNMEAQARLLRVLDGGSFYRVGGTKEKKVDVRIIAATNKGLKKQVEQGQFRKDLFYRINTIHITMPPLRERRDDILLLINYFLESYAQEQNVKEKELSHEVIELFMDYEWPGNVRELRNLIERLIILSGKDKTIELKHIPMEMDIMPASHPKLRSIDHNGSRGAKLKNALKSLEKEIIARELKGTEWDKTATCKDLGISYSSLNNKIAQFNIQPEPNPGH